MSRNVETNFVLERSLEQEQSDSCGKILELASQLRIALVIPAFSLAEPHDAISRRASARSRLGGELRPHLYELGRSRQLQYVPGTFDALAEVLIEAGRLERQGLRMTVDRLLTSTEVIPLTQASAVGLQDRFRISGQDSIVLASIFMDLKRRKPGWSCFMNRNSRDFDDPDIRAELEALHCKFFANFEDGLSYIVHKLAE